MALLDAQARAVVAERARFSRSLSKRVTALGDKAPFSEVAQNMNLVSCSVAKKRVKFSRKWWEERALHLH